MTINWGRLSRAVTYYQTKGYTYIEAPWAVPDEIVAITAQPDAWREGARTSIGTLVGSAEQSFLHLDNVAELGKGRFVACTPCFRLTELNDGLHQKHFMKVELYQNDDLSERALTRLRQDAYQFANTEVKAAGALDGMVNWIMTEEGFDLNIGYVEIGSYGRRDKWLYGTGVAEPRFTTAIGLYGGG